MRGFSFIPLAGFGPGRAIVSHGLTGGGLEDAVVRASCLDSALWPNPELTSALYTNPATTSGLCTGSALTSGVRISPASASVLWINPTTTSPIKGRCS